MTTNARDAVQLTIIKTWPSTLCIGKSRGVSLCKLAKLCTFWTTLLTGSPCHPWLGSEGKYTVLPGLVLVSLLMLKLE